MQPSTRHQTEEQDIGSGERSPGQRDTEKMIEKVPANPNKPGSVPASAPPSSPPLPSSPKDKRP